MLTIDSLPVLSGPHRFAWFLVLWVTGSLALAVIHWALRRWAQSLSSALVVGAAASVPCALVLMLGLALVTPGAVLDSAMALTIVMVGLGAGAFAGMIYGAAFWYGHQSDRDRGF